MGAGGDKRAQFFTAIVGSKLATVRWSLSYGGLEAGTRNEAGDTALMVAVKANKVKVLQLMLDHVRKSRLGEQMDLTDGEGDGNTALHMAAAMGKKDLCNELLYAKCNASLRNAAGKTAEQVALARGFKDLAGFIARGGEDEEVEDDGDDENETGRDGLGKDGLTSTQRNKLKKREMQGKVTGKVMSEEEREALEAEMAREEAEEAEEQRRESVKASAAWPEVQTAASTNACELAIERPGESAVDAAVWGLTHSLNNLKIHCGASLTSVSDSLGSLKKLLVLNLAGNGLTELPGSIKELTGLKTLEVSNNALTKLTKALGKLKSLERLDCSNNAIKSLEPLEKCENLVSLSCDNNAITSLDGVGAKPRMQTLSASGNAIVSLPEDISELYPKLEFFYVRANKVEEVPADLGNCKKLKDLGLDDNPLEDPKVKKMVQKGDGAALLKDLIPYLKKSAKGGGGKKGKK